MKKITKNLVKRFAVIMLGIALSCSSSFAVQQYCHKAITSTDATSTVYLSCQLLTAGNYQIKIESDVELTGLGGSFCHVNGAEVYALNAEGHFTLSTDKKTITCDIASTTAPDMYTPLYVLMPGEKVFNWPTDVDWTGTCGPVVEDTEIPTAFTAVKGAVTSSSVELLLNATDNSGAVTYTVSYGSTPTILTVSGASATQKSYVVSGLDPSTEYTFSIVAKDAALNAATNTETVIATTTAAPVLSTIDFETVGQDWAWTLFENGDNAPALYSVAANPSATGINTSANCAKYIVNTNGQPWAGLWSANLPDFTFTANNCIVKVMVYKSVITNFGVKFENDNASVAFEKLVANTLTDQWELLTFDFTSQIGKSITKLVIIPDFPTARTVGSTNYFDNISFNSSISTSISELNRVDVNLFPNPVKDQLQVVSGKEISQVIVRNLLGQTVKTTMVNGLEKSIDLNAISAGNYFVTVKLANGQSTTQKFIKL